MEARLVLDTPNEQGKVERESLEHILDTQPEDSLPYQDAYNRLSIEVPACGEHIWHWYHYLHNSRQYGMNGPNPISYFEIKSWAELTQTYITPSEIELIKYLDFVYLGFSHKKQREKQKQKQPSKRK